MTTPNAPAAAQAAASGKGAWVNVQIGQNHNVAGPFTVNQVAELASVGIHMYPSQAAAAAATPQNLSATQVKMFEQVILQGPGVGQGFGLGQNISSAVSTLSNAAAIFDVAHWIGELVTHLTDIFMWRSLGWILLGLVLLVVGILLLLKKMDVLPTVVPVPV